MGIRFHLAFCTLLALFFTAHARARLSLFAADPPALSLQAQAQPPAEKEQSFPEKIVDGEGRENEEAEAPAKERHHSRDRSVAGGGVIIGGLATAIFATVYCYIRVTRNRTPIEPAPAHTQPQPNLAK